jgi:hypothetical protein
MLPKKENENKNDLNLKPLIVSRISGLFGGF